MPVPGAERRMNETRPKKMYQFDWMVGESPDLVMVNSRPEEVEVTLPEVMFQADESRAEVVKSWV